MATLDFVLTFAFASRVKTRRGTPHQFGHLQFVVHVFAELSEQLLSELGCILSGLRHVSQRAVATVFDISPETINHFLKNLGAFMAAYSVRVHGFDFTTSQPRQCRHCTKSLPTSPEL